MEFSSVGRAINLHLIGQRFESFNSNNQIINNLYYTSIVYINYIIGVNIIF